MNVEKIKVMRISRESFPLQIMIGQKKLENVEYFNRSCPQLVGSCEYGNKSPNSTRSYRFLQ
jgi:hypothetical protein